MRVVQKAILKGRTQVTVFQFGPRSRQLTSIRLVDAKEKILAEEGAADCPASDPVEIAKLLGEIKDGQVQK